jgi:hypothetical protein
LAIETVNNNQKIKATTKYPTIGKTLWSSKSSVILRRYIVHLFRRIKPANYLFIFFLLRLRFQLNHAGEEKKKDIETIKRVMMSLLGLQKWLERERLTAFFGAPFELLANRWCCWLYE